MATDYTKSEKTIRAFLQNAKVVDIAKAAGLSRSTVYRLQKDSLFQEVLIERRAAMVRTATDQMRQYFLRDVQILQEIAEDTNNPAGTRVYACSTLMNQLNTWTQNTDFEQRLAALERETKNGDLRQFGWG